MTVYVPSAAVALGVPLGCVSRHHRVSPVAGPFAVPVQCPAPRTLLARTQGYAARYATRIAVHASLRRRVTVAAQLAAAAGAAKPRTLFDKIWADHVVDESPDGTCLLYIDRHLVHEVTSPQAFEGLRTAGRAARRPDCTLATADHNVPTSDRSGFVDVGSFIKEVESRTQVLALEDNVKEFGIAYFGMDDRRQGIVHIIGPEQGFTLPGCTTVCGDSHTATHGAFGALAFGIGTSEVEHVLATQTLVQKRAANMLVRVDGVLGPGVTSKDLILHVIGVIGTAGGTGHVIEFAGDGVRALSMEARMSMCNMAIEAGARAGMVAPDEVTFAYLKGRPLAPAGAEWDAAVAYWRTLASDPGAHYDKTVVVRAADVAPIVTWGTSPQDVAPITGVVPNPAAAGDAARKAAMERSLTYMGLSAGTRLAEVPVQKVFIGSCTNGRIEDLREAARVAQGRHVAPGVYAMVVPGSGLVKDQAQAEGLDAIFTAAGFDWREPGCSMCLAMNPDKLEPGERCASTSNRNFEGRQGNGGRTHLCSPAMAAAAAVTGRLTDVRALPPLKPLPGASRESKEFLGAVPIARSPTKAGASAKTSSGGAATATGIPKFVTLKGCAAPLDIQNIDTDMIIPKQFLKTIKRTGLGVSAFYELRYDGQGKERADFVLNQEPYRKACILVAGDNFGCGSSREHAPWALNDFGLRCIISTSFADIFFNNCFKNGMLPVKLSREQVEVLLADARDKKPLEVDLPSQRVIRANGESFAFEIDAFRKHCLLNGLDDIGLTLAKADQITQFEAKQRSAQPWLARGIPQRADAQPVAR